MTTRVKDGLDVLPCPPDGACDTPAWQRLRASLEPRGVDAIVGHKYKNALCSYVFVSSLYRPLCILVIECVVVVLRQMHLLGCRGMCFVRVHSRDLCCGLCWHKSWC